MDGNGSKSKSFARRRESSLRRGARSDGGDGESRRRRAGDAENGNAAESKLEHAEVETSEMVREIWSSIEEARARGGVRRRTRTVLDRRRVRGGLRGGARVCVGSTGRDVRGGERDERHGALRGAVAPGARRGRLRKSPPPREQQPSRGLVDAEEVARSGELVSSRSTSPRVSWRPPRLAPLPEVPRVAVGGDGAVADSPSRRGRWRVRARRSRDSSSRRRAAASPRSRCRRRERLGRARHTQPSLALTRHATRDARRVRWMTLGAL